MNNTFTLTDHQRDVLATWLREQRTALAKEQLKDPAIAHLVLITDDQQHLPYTGAIGGELTYRFTPTSLGDIVEVVWCGGTKWEQSVDLTEYDLF